MVTKKSYKKWKIWTKFPILFQKNIVLINLKTEVNAINTIYVTYIIKLGL